MCFLCGRLDSCTVSVDNGGYWPQPLGSVQLSGKVATELASIRLNALRKGVSSIGDPDEKLKKLFQKLIGSLMYAMLGTRPDIAFAVGILGRYALKFYEG